MRLSSLLYSRANSMLLYGKLSECKCNTDYNVY
jgi:hypothetical protein